jgi:hypothetical protein
LTRAQTFAALEKDYAALVERYEAALGVGQYRNPSDSDIAKVHAEIGIWLSRPSMASLAAWRWDVFQRQSIGLMLRRLRSMRAHLAKRSAVQPRLSPPWKPLPPNPLGPDDHEWREQK